MTSREIPPQAVDPVLRTDGLVAERPDAYGWVAMLDPAELSHHVAVDVQTAVVVRLRPVDGPEDSPWLENDILEVDADVEDRSTPPR